MEAPIKDGYRYGPVETLAAIAIVNQQAIFLLQRYLKGGLTTIQEFLEKTFDTNYKND